MDITVVDGNLLDQNTETLVNPWNRNIIPWWLLLPSGVSGAIKKKGGLQPFIELGKLGPIPLGSAVVTSAGRLPFKCLVHVASIDLLWRASRFSIHDSVLSAMALAEQSGILSIAFPLLGAGAGGFDREESLSIMREAFLQIDSTIRVTLVRHTKQ